MPMNFCPNITRWLVILILSEGFVGLSQGAELPMEWERHYGGTSNDFLFAIAEAPTGGGFVLGGYSNSDSDDHKTSPRRGENDYWLVRVDAQGDPIWEQTYGGTDQDLLACLYPVGEGYIAGGTSLSGVNGNKTSPNLGLRDYWVIRLNSEGDAIWEKSYGGTGSDYLQDLKPTPDGGFLLGGYSFSGTNGTKTSPNHGLIDYWIVKVNEAGDSVWDKSIGGGGNDYLSKVALTTNGGYILAGYSFSIEGGTKSAPRHGGSDFWIVRLDAQGNLLWDRTFGGTLNEYCQGLLALDDGGFLLSGYSFSGADGNKTSPQLGQADFWIVKLDGAGTKQWETTLGGTGDDNAWSLARMANGDFLVGGWSDSSPGDFKSGSTYGRSDYWLTLLSAEGDLLNDYAFGGTQDEVILSIQPTADAGCLLGGYSFSGATGSKTSPSHGESDYWLIKLGPVVVSEDVLPTLTVHHQLHQAIAADGFRFTLRGQPDQTYILECSTNLIDWIAFATNVLTGSETVITDTTAESSPNRHYRARVAE